MRTALDLSYSKQEAGQHISASKYIHENFGQHAQLALELLPTSKLSPQPLYGLLDGFDMDLLFSYERTKFPVADEQILRRYAERVAGTVAELCIQIIYHHIGAGTSKRTQQEILKAGSLMGIALQYVNIARDIRVDAAIGRVYIPTTWIEEQGLKPQDILHDPDLPQVELLRQRLLDEAFKCYEEARPKIERLPPGAKGPMRVTVESYMEIGRTLRSLGYKVKDGRATVSKWRRLWIAWTTLGA